MDSAASVSTGGRSTEVRLSVADAINAWRARKRAAPSVAGRANLVVPTEQLQKYVGGRSDSGDPENDEDDARDEAGNSDSEHEQQQRGGAKKKVRRFRFTKFSDSCEPPYHGTFRYQKYIVMQHERCPDTGRLHWQCYLESTHPVRVALLQKEFIRGAHYKPCSRSRAANVAYCTKEESRHECNKQYSWGSTERKRKQADAFDWGQFVEQARRTSLRNMFEQFPAATVRHWQAVKKIRSLEKIERPDGVELIILLGAPGTGKSRTCKMEWPDGWYKPADLSTKGDAVWWDTYDGEETIIWNDFRPELLPLTVMLQLVDFYPLKLPVKGSFEGIAAHRVVLTTNSLTPENWYEGDEAWRRRIDDFGTIRDYGTTKWKFVEGKYPPFIMRKEADRNFEKRKQREAEAEKKKMVAKIGQSKRLAKPGKYTMEGDPMESDHEAKSSSESRQPVQSHRSVFDLLEDEKAAEDELEEMRRLEAAASEEEPNDSEILHCTCTKEAICPECCALFDGDNAAYAAYSTYQYLDGEAKQ